MKILGISAYYHDSAACLLTDGEVTAAAQEERFSRDKHDASFPRRAIEYCLAASALDSPAELDFVVFYDKPIVKFDRLLTTYLHYAPRGLESFLKAMPQWLKQKLRMRDTLRRELGYEGELLFTEHHESHAASAFYPSPFERAAVLTVDGVGEWTTASIGRGEGHRLEVQEELHFPHSLGLLYSAFTFFTGFKVNGGEYKLMGLAPYGEPRFVDTILSELVELHDDGSLRLNMDFFDFGARLKMTGEGFRRLFGGPERAPEGPLTQREMDLARSIQVVTEEAVLRMARHAHELTGEKRLVMAGGVALNCVANGRLLREGPFEDVWIQPAAGDAGGALGAALFVHHQLLGHERRTAQGGSRWGPSYGDDELGRFLEGRGVQVEPASDDGELARRVAGLLAEGKVVGWFQGRMEFGPRALGARSILGDPRDPEMQSRLNLKIKFRESFRPFAPAVLASEAGRFFELDRESPYMLLTAAVHPDQRLEVKGGGAEGLGKLKVARSKVPAVTHVDGSARVQTVGEEAEPRFPLLLEAFERATGCPVLVNTSFNVRGEPIVCTPEDAWRTFRRTHMDVLVLGRHVVEREAVTAGAEPRWTAPAADPEEERRETKEARRFGAILAAVLAVVAGVSYTLGHPERAWGAGCLAIIVLVLAFAATPLWRVVHRGWMRLATKIGELISLLALSLAFYAVLTPIGLLKRLTGGLRFDAAWKDGKKSLWREKRQVTATVERYKKQH